MDKFEFKHKTLITKDLYVNTLSIYLKYKRSKLFRFLITMAVGILCLFWIYTFLLGICIIIFILFGTLFTNLIPQTSSFNYYEYKHFLEEVEFGVNQDKCWAKNDSFVSEAEWKYYKTWVEKDGWILLRGSGFVPVFLPVNELKKQGLYIAVLEYAKKYGKGFGEIPQFIYDKDMNLVDVK